MSRHPRAKALTSLAVAASLAFATVGCSDDDVAIDDTDSSVTEPADSSPSSTEDSGPSSTESPSAPSTQVAEPPDDTGTTALGDEQVTCSAAGLEATFDPKSLPETDAGPTAERLVDAAVSCDTADLVEVATSDGTALSFGGLTPEQVFALPEESGEPYATLATVLTRTEWAAQPDDSDPGFIWPRVATTEWADSDEAWREVIDAGLVSETEADQMRAGGGYLGHRIGIATDGTWEFFVAGD